MKILLINSRYFLSAGPEKYLFGLEEMLENAGHEVIVFSVKNSNNKKTKYEKYFANPVGGKDLVYYKDYKKTPKTIMQVFGRQFYSFHVKRKLRKLIKDTRPDVAYLLHHQNKLSPSVIGACKQEGVPVVMRLSDFGLVCPEGHLFRNEQPCELCIKKSLCSAVKYRCVRNSFFGSLVKASALKFQRLIGVYKKVSYIVSPSKFTIAKVKGVLDKNKLVFVPTFILGKKKPSTKLGSYMLFVGRIEEIKGLLYVIKAVQGTPYRLKIVGGSSSGHDDELKQYVSKHNITNVEFLGPQFGDELATLYRNSRFVVVPSLCYDNLPNVALEAMHYGKPLLVTNIGSMKSIVKENYNGYLCTPRDVRDMQKKIKLLYNDATCKRLGKNAYHESQTTYNPDTHYAKLMTLFKKAIREAGQ